MNGPGHRPISHLFQLRTEGGKDNRCWIREKRNKKTPRVYTESDNRPPSLLHLPIMSMKEWIKKRKNSPKNFFPHFYSVFSLYSLHLISLLFVMSHLLSFMCRMVCQGRLEAGACASTAIVQYQYCDGWGAARPHISSECKDNWKEEASQTWHPSHFKESLSRRNKTSPDKAKLAQDKSK